jgi:hypothetical protein
MFAQDYLARSRLARRLENGCHRQLIERYAARLAEDGLAIGSLCDRWVWLVTSLIGWLVTASGWPTWMKLWSKGFSGTEPGSGPCIRVTARH